MYALKLLRCGERRVGADEAGELRRVEGVQHGTQAVRPFGMTGGGLVAKAGCVGDEEGLHGGSLAQVVGCVVPPIRHARARL